MNTSIKRVAYTLCTLLTLVIFSPSSHAEWEKVSSSKGDDGTTRIHYVDQDTIVDNGDKVQMWFLTIYSSPFKGSNFTYSSVKAHEEFDCKLKANRLRYIAHYASKDGSGNPLSGQSIDSKWEPAIPGSILAAMLKFACN